MSSPGDDIRLLLAECWRDGRLGPFCDIVLQHLSPRLKFLAVTRGLTDEEAEDALASGLEAVVSRYDGLRSRVREPYNYLCTIVKNQAEDIRRERESRLLKTAEMADERAASGEGNPGVTTVTPEWAGLVIGELTDTIEPESLWAVEVARAAVARLPRGEREVIEYLAQQDLEGAERAWSLCPYRAVRAHHPLRCAAPGRSMASHRH